MLGSGDGKTRDVVTAIQGAGWDFNMSRHPFYEIEAPLKPYYTLYNRRHMTLGFDNHISVEDGYWLLRQKAAVLNTAELPLQFRGPDAERLLDLLFTKDMTKLKPGRCGYGLACYDDGGLIVDGVVVRLEPDLFWYVQADGDFLNWAKAHARGMDVEISDPQIFVSQMQGPASLDILAAACDDGKLPAPFTYFGCARVSLGGQDVVITRTGYTNELGWEYYIEPHHDALALWAHLAKAGKPFGMTLFGLDSMHIRRIEAGILNANSDFDAFTTPFAAGLGRFVDMEKEDFIGKAALTKADRASRITGIACPTAEPLIGGLIFQQGRRVGRITAGAFSPYLKTGVGIALFEAAAPEAAIPVEVTCIDGEVHAAQTHSMPFYDAACEIPRGKLVDIPQRL
ncbi:MAG: aminomethyltransferase family protein [Pseudomonadota bacterium]